MDRKYYYSNRVSYFKLDGEDYFGNEEETLTPATVHSGNLITSELTNGNHAPALDIDLPCQLVESQTPGHFHLYISKEMSWRKYKKLMKSLAKAGILEKKYVKHSIKKKKSCLRVPRITYTQNKTEIVA